MSTISKTVCEICGESFLTEDQLSNHITDRHMHLSAGPSTSVGSSRKLRKLNTHTKDSASQRIRRKPLVVGNCVVCGKDKFYSLRHMNAHIEQHFSVHIHQHFRDVSPIIEISDEDDDVSNVDDKEKPILQSISKDKSKRNDDKRDKQNEDLNPDILERQDLEKLDDDYQWYYEGKNDVGCGKQNEDLNPALLERQDVEKLDVDFLWSFKDKYGTWKYEKQTSEEIERNFKENIKTFDLLICGTLYTIDLVRYVLYNRGNPTKRRRLIRVSANDIAVEGYN